MRASNHLLSFESAVECLLRQGVLFFPTETFYAVGCLWGAERAIEKIYAIKRRDPSKPLPVACEKKEDVEAILQCQCIPREIFSFWPGPLTLVCPVKASLHLPPLLLSRHGELALRVSSNRITQMLAHQVSSPLTVSSANISGIPPVTRWQDLDERLFESLDTMPWGILGENEGLGGGLPSTILGVNAESSLTKTVFLLRSGCIAPCELKRRGLHVE